jgi:hypothetical protein
MHKFAMGHASVSPLVEAAIIYDIATNNDPRALFEAGPGGLQLWCTEADNPGGLWTRIEMKKGIYTKPCAFIGAVRWQGGAGRSEEVKLVMTTIAYALCEKELVAMESIHNRADDVDWARRKMEWLWKASGSAGPMLQILVSQ